MKGVSLYIYICIYVINRVFRLRSREATSRKAVHFCISGLLKRCTRWQCARVEECEPADWSGAVSHPGEKTCREGRSTFQTTTTTTKTMSRIRRLVRLNRFSNNRRRYILSNRTLEKLGGGGSDEANRERRRARTRYAYNDNFGGCERNERGGSEGERRREEEGESAERMPPRFERG